MPTTQRETSVAARPAPRQAAGTLKQMKTRDRIRTLATEVWGDKDAASQWLKAPHIELHGDAPKSLLKMTSGIRKVENLLSALENGFPV